MAKYVVYTDISRNTVREAIEWHAEEVYQATVTEMVLKDDDQYLATENTIVVTVYFTAPSQPLTPD